jgi:hypothetical protein
MGTAAAQEVSDEYDQSYHQQQVNKTAANVTDKTKQP